MSNILENKIKKLEELRDYECWYLVKQPTEFSTICYLVSFLEEYQNNESIKDNYNLQNYIEKRAEKVDNIKISKNYRALRVAAFYGLIKMQDSKYENAFITETFFEIKKTTNSRYEKIELYQQIINRQIEKMFISSPVDEENNGIREKYRLFPILFLYKVLLEIGKTNQEAYSITMTEYRYLVATAEKYEDFLKTLLEIVELRNNSQYNEKLEYYRAKFDNRMNQALKQLDTIYINQNIIGINNEKIDEIRKKIYIFESSYIKYDDIKYIDFLGSKDSLFDLIREDSSNNFSERTEENLFKSNIKQPHQRIFFGAPGTGKSYELNNEAKDNFGKNYERVTFHPNYMYGNFVGSFKPFPKILKTASGDIKKDEDGNIQETITYEYIPGILIKQLIKAFKNPKENYLLLIEEINRANVSAAFGDIFQLLDRDKNGESQYFISTSKELQEFLKIEFDGFDLEDNIREKLGNDFSKLFLPNNFYLWATMNSADQGVMPIDTAFKRRWEFKYLGINDAADKNKEEFDTYQFKISPTETVNWDQFRRELNKRLVNFNIPEDKLVGPYFVSKSILEDLDIDKLTEIIKNKVLMYLYEDAAKAFRSSLFKKEYCSTYSSVCEGFDKNALNLFIPTIEISTKELKVNKVEIFEKSEELEKNRKDAAEETVTYDL